MDRSDGKPVFSWRRGLVDSMVSANQQTDLHLIWQYRVGDDAAQDTLIEKYLPMVRHIVRNHYAGFLDFDDLVQEGLIGLLGAISEYRPDRFDVKFSSFAYLCIQRKVFNAVKQYTGNKHRLLNQATSLHGNAHGDDGRTMFDYVPSNEVEADPAALIENRLVEEGVRGVLRDHLSSLEYAVTLLLAEGYTAREIEREFGLSPKRVDNARTRVKAKLRQLLRSYGTLDHPRIRPRRRRRPDLALQLQLGV